MSKWVLDASALLAVLLREPGSEKVIDRIPHASISTVNLAEVLTKLAERDDVTEHDILSFENLGMNIVKFDTDQARKAAELKLTKHLGLSLGDRCCLALAMHLNATAVTADRQWKKVKLAKVEVIR